MHARGALVSIYVQLFFKESSHKIDLNSTQVNFALLQKSEMIPLWLDLEATHVSAWSHWSEAHHMHLAGREPGQWSHSFGSGCSGYVPHRVGPLFRADVPVPSCWEYR